MNERRLRARLLAPLAVLTVVLGVTVAAAGMTAGSATTATPRATTTRSELHDGMRMLWEEHVTWTRLFIVADVGHLADLGATTNRLLANQVDIGNAIKPFYGDAAGDHLTALLRRHILLAAQLLGAAKAGDTTGVATARAAWYANATEIARFLHEANPAHWPLADLEAMMREHLDLTLAEAVDELSGSSARSVADYDRVEREILGMADVLSGGIIAQMPTSFR